MPGRRDASKLRILLRGEFDLTARPALEQLFLDLDPTRLERVLVDIRQVTFFDTTGLNMAYRLDRWGREHGVAVLFTTAIPEVTRGLRAAGLTLSLTFSDAPEDQLPPHPERHDGGRRCSAVLAAGAAPDRARRVRWAVVRWTAASAGNVAPGGRGALLRTRTQRDE